MRLRLSMRFQNPWTLCPHIGPVVLPKYPPGRLKIRARMRPGWAAGANKRAPGYPGARLPAFLVLSSLPPVPRPPSQIFFQLMGDSLNVNWFCQMVVHAALQALLNIFRKHVGSHGDNGDARVLAHQSAMAMAASRPPMLPHTFSSPQRLAFNLSGKPPPLLFASQPAHNLEHFADVHRLCQVRVHPGILRQRDILVKGVG